MPTRSALVIGSTPGCDIQLQAAGVAARHAQLSWRDGLWLQDLGHGATSVEGRTLAPNESVQLPGFHTNVMLGGVRFFLTAPEVTQLYLERSSLPADSNTIVVGRDPARAHLLIAHPSISGAHLRVDLGAGTVTDPGSTSGSFDRHGQRIPTQQALPLDTSGGYFLGMIWLPTSVLLDLGRSSAQGGVWSQGKPILTAQPGGLRSPVAVAFGPGNGGGHAMVATSAQPAMAANEPFTPAPTALAAAPAARESARAPARPRTMFGQLNLAGAAGGAGQAIIGRLPTCDIVMPYPQLSARHASVARTPDGNLAVADLGSTNGTYVNGGRLEPHRPAIVRPGDKIFVGPYPVIVDLEGDFIRAYIDQDKTEWPGNLVEVEALDLFLRVPDRERKTQDKVLLNHITFKARPGDLIALMGPSGAGKTTLLTVLNGYLRPSAGEVRINGENLYAIYDALRGSIGYVPQDDIVHPELTVWEAIKYSAQFRLPPDYSDEEINRRVEQTVRDLGLEQVKNLEIGKPERKVLSGGQRKRVNIALELVTDPALMFLDEPTSGLAADDTVALIDLLSNLAKKKGKTIIVTIHQPAREEYEKFNLALVMGFGGEPLYYGPTGKESYDFFARYVAAKNIRIDNPRDMFDLLKQREDEMVTSGAYANKPLARLAAAQAWRADYFRNDNPTHRKMYSGARQPGTPGRTLPPSRAKVPLLRQFKLLLERYAIVKRRDRAGTIIMLAQAPIIGVLLAMVFSNPSRLPNMWCRLAIESMEINARADGAMLNPVCIENAARFPRVADFTGALFFLAIASIWFGTSNAAREIVAEQAIYRRERMVNLSIFNYVGSKFALLSSLCIVQCTVLLGIVYPAVGLGGGDWAAFPTMLYMMILTAMCAVAIGLLLSTVVVSSEAAMALTPIALIPQVVLGGRMVPMTSKSWLEPVMAIVPARWSFEGVLAAERQAIANAWRVPMCNSGGTGVEGGFFQCALEEVRNRDSALGGLGFTTYDRPAIAAGVMVLMTFVVMGLVVVLLKRRDSV